ncbi:hypothetical protein HMPREF9622_01999 [Cutibacterium modestum HL037PA3]|nr:hypothetical protein HMPREF9622_01999 [Cutibacterium modestum HL037PA3]
MVCAILVLPDRERLKRGMRRPKKLYPLTPTIIVQRKRTKE